MLERNNNDYQITDPFKTMALQMIVDSHLVREYEKTFLNILLIEAPLLNHTEMPQKWGRHNISPAKR